VDVLDALATVVPVVLLFALGAVLRRAGIVSPATLDDLRRLVLVVTLPAALFLTFLRVEVDPRYLLIVVTVFAACVAVLVAGTAWTRLAGGRSPVVAPLLTGFEAGMLGYGIYAAVFGTAALYRFAIVDLGQVVFVFFVLATVLARRTADAPATLMATMATFIRTPVILAIAGGMAASVVGLTPVLDEAPAGRALLATLAILAAMTMPLIALVIGGSLRLDVRWLGRPAAIVAARTTLWVALALVFNAVVIEGLLGLDRLFAAAVLTMAVLPPPFVIPLYLRPGSVAERDREDVLNTLSLGTLVTLVAVAVIAVVYAP
jgi:malate permease and related proteins